LFATPIKFLAIVSNTLTESSASIINILLG
jgi:hypothetical protein